MTNRYLYFVHSDAEDKFSTSVELSVDLNLFNSADAHGDKDHNRIDDGAEFEYWQSYLYNLWDSWVNEETGAEVNETSLSYCRIPDVDNDSIPDGKEIKGYEVKIITGWKSDGTPISEMRFISADELDPLTPYANKTGVYTDSDEDGIPDIAESMLSNRSKWDDFKANYPDLWSEYSWIQSYFWTVVDKDYDEHGNWTSAIENATQWLKDQFNPLIRDCTPPMITKFTLRWEVEFSVSLEPVKVYAHLHLVVRDVGGISYLYILDEDSGESITYTDAGSMLDINHKFKASILTATFGSVKISIVAEDNAHNVLSAEKELKGALKKVLDALRSLWNAIWNTLCKVAEAMAKAFEILIEWIKGVISGVISIFEGLINVVSGLGRHLVDLLLLSYNNYKNTGTIGTESIKINEILDSIAIVVTAIISVIIGIMIILDVATFGLGEIVLGLASTLILSYLMSNIMIGIVSEKEITLSSAPSALTPFWIVGVLKAIFGLETTTIYSSKDTNINLTIILDYLLNILTFFTCFYTLYLIATIDFTGATGMMMAMVASIAGLVISGVTIFILHTMPPDERTLIGFVEAIFGIFALIGTGLLGKPVKGYFMPLWMKILNYVCVGISLFCIAYAFYAVGI